MNQAFSKLCFIQVESQGSNVPPVTSDDNDDAVQAIRWTFHNVLSFQLFFVTLLSTRRKSQAWGYFRDLKITLKLIFEIDTEFLFGNDSTNKFSQL